MRGVLTAQGEGTTTVIAADKKNPSNRAAVRVVSLSPDSIRLSPERLEVQVGHKVNVGLVVADTSGNTFDDCPHLGHAKWRLSDPSVLHMMQDLDTHPAPEEGLCAKKVGHPAFWELDKRPFFNHLLGLAIYNRYL